MTVPRISVVVPFHNNEDLIGDCLESIAAQTFTDLEVIVVDDGSTDDGAAIARSYAAADPRFTVVTTENGGPGHARNVGLRQVTGEYLAFVDGDDMLPGYAYERMLHALESSGSDFVSGGVERIGPAGINPSALHLRAIKERRTGTHISREPELFWDVSVFNKLFRKSFWDASGLSFPEGMVWEDLQAMTRAHVLARAVDVIPDTVYYWRERGKGALSITQSRTDIRNLRDRITALLVIDSFLRGRGSAKLLRQHQRKALVNDLWLYVCDLSRTSDEYRDEFIELTGKYLAQVDRRVFGKLPAGHKLAYHLISKRKLAELAEFSSWLDAQLVFTPPIIRKHGRLRADLPFLGDRSRKIPARVYRPHWRELDPFIRVEELGWQGNRLAITGCAFVPSVDIIKRRHTSKIVVLLPRGRPLRPPIVVPARSLRHEEATTWSAQDRYAYDWAGFRCEINPRWFRVSGRWLTGAWDCFVLVRARGVWRPARLHTPVKGQAERPEFREVAPGVRLGARWSGLRLQVAVVKTPAVLSHCERSGDCVVLEVDADLTTPEAGPALVLSRAKGAAARRYPATVSSRNGTVVRLRGTIPLSPLLAELGSADPVAAAAGGEAGGAEWELRVAAEGREPVPVAFPARLAEVTWPEGRQEIALERARSGNVVIVRRRPRPVIEEQSWDRGGQLTLRGRYPAAAEGRFEAVLRRRTSTDQHLIELSRDGDRFAIGIDVGAMPSFGQKLPLRDGFWDIFVRRAAQADAELVVPGYDHGRLEEIDDSKVEIGQKVYQFTTSGYDAPLITVRPALRLTEQGRLQRRMLSGMYYPLQLRLPLRDSVIFVSWKGKQCGDNPLAIAQELRRRGDDREHIWAIEDWCVPVPPGARGVLTGTEDYFEALGRCRYLISNDDMQGNFQKRDGQVYVQTWHGTPLKRIGFDIENPQFISGISYFDHLAGDVAKWDLLLSPNPFSTPIMRRAFRFDGEICESGYPRNDVLRGGDVEAVAAEARRRIGLPEGKRAVLYAPTWRDNQYYASGRYRFDFRLDLERAWQELGDDYVFLVRGHHHMADDVPAGARPGFAINVTGYPDISELFLVSDVLVTDYSSAMFDFAVTGRPIILYTYDLEAYRDKLRGFYFDLEAEAPGPLLATSDEVVAAIADSDSVLARHRAAYDAFVAKFCPLDDGKAGARACDRIFGS
jgi:CDP-glycerol glycerophosphotransferase